MMRLYADSGRRGAAIQLYRALSEALLKDVNTQPEAETRQVFASIAQANDGELSGPAAACDRTDAAIPSDISAPARKWRRSLMGLAAVCLAALALGFTWWIHREPGTASAGARASGHDIDPGSYEQFLRVLPLIRARQTGVPQAVQILESLVARNPDFAPAWAQLAYAYCLMSTNLPPNSVWPYSAEGLIQTRERAARYWPQAAAAAQRAIQLDPKLPAAYLALGVLEHFRGRLLAADDLFAKALNLDPYNPDILAWRMALLADVGKQGEALAVAQQLTALDPYVPTWKQDAAEVFWENEYYDTANEMLQSLQNRPSGPTSLAMIYASQGRYAEAADILETSLNVKGEFLRGLALRWHTATRLLRVAPAKAATLPDSPGLGRLSFVYLHVGAPERSLEQYEDDIRSGFVGGYGVSFSYLWHPSYAPVRKTERFKSLMRNAGMVDYWRQRGWPASCRPAGADDFVCR
jgi:tetratricopeptide (TPR) repeat protein